MTTPARALLIAFFALAAPATAQDMVERRIGNLAVTFPTGDGWHLEEREPGTWVSGRLRKNANGDPVYLHTILAEQLRFPASFHDWLPIEVATDYFLWEIDALKANCGEGGDYDLLDLDVREDTRAGHTLHVLRSVKDYREPWHPMLEKEAQELYLLFPADFATSTTVYKVYIAANCFFEGCTVDDLDLSELTPLLDEIRDLSALTD